MEAAIASGAPNRQLILGDMLPNVLPVVIVLLAADDRARTSLTEAALSFLSIGVQPPNASWGTIIEDGQSLLYTRPWVSIAPGMLIAITVLALNVLGDGVRDALDPRGSLRIRRRSGRDGMSAFVIRRLASMLLVLFAISVLVFVIFFAIPGVDPAAPDGRAQRRRRRRSRRSSTSSGSTSRCRSSTCS